MPPLPFVLLFVLPFSILFGLSIFSKTRYIIFDRTQGLISYPGPLGKKSIVSEFDNVAANISLVGRMGLALKLFHSNGITYTTLSSYNQIQDWCLYVWYMDKNRPLPPGNAFDPYRQKDFERRKAEGFPPPLYPSFIPTPEATTEQQVEREQYWEERFTNSGKEIQRHLWVKEK